MATGKLRNLQQALRNGDIVEEKVEVNQRHLIDKILARYSAEYTFLRELLQNSNDAGASDVSIVFQTSPANNSNSQSSTAATIVYRNNGRPFQAEDWSRLRKIAEGNPDEQKIGFFGVGFYSLFSIAEEPLVESGSECMGFFWKGDQLFTKRSKLDESTPLTTFFLDLREPMDIPNVADLGRFLATSMAFTSNLCKVELFVDGMLVFQLNKKVADARPLSFSKGAYTLSSPNQMFTLDSVRVRPVQMDVLVHEHFNARSQSLGEATSYNIFMRAAVASCSVRLAPKFGADMERTTKKRAPATIDLQIVCATHDEYESSTRGTNVMFRDLVPAPNEQGKVFIGFPTHQTTGCSMHIAAHLIPTVERESIDFVDRTLNIWNQETIVVAGLLARIIYEDEFASICRLYPEMASDPDSRLWLEKRGAHTMASFAFHPSTPAALVGRIGAQYFVKLAKDPVSVISTRGVLPVSKVRLPLKEAEEFVKNIPMIPEIVQQECKDLLKEWERDGVIQKVGLEDVFEELAGRDLSITELVALMKWWIQYRKEHSVKDSDVIKLLRLATLADVNDSSKRRSLSRFKCHVTNRFVPADMPIPEDCLPFEICKGFKKDELELNFGHWTELSLPEWVSFMAKNPELELAAPFAEKVLAIVSRVFPQLTGQHRAMIVSILGEKRCVPTRLGMKLPGESYFKSVTLFGDLPSVTFAHPKTVSEPFLRALGVREIVDLQTVFDRLGTELGWDHMQLVKYLGTVHSKLSIAEMDRLRVTPLFPREQRKDGEHAAKDASSDITSPPHRYKASELFVPSEVLRSLEFPIIAWDNKWRPQTDESKLLLALGLQTIIPLADLLSSASTSPPARRTKFLAYFIDNYKHYGPLYRPTSSLPAFLPTTTTGTLANPTMCFADAGAAVMGFPVLHPELKGNAEKFGVRSHPTGDLLMKRLAERPPTPGEAGGVFAYLSGRVSEFTPAQWATLKNTKFVPIRRAGGSKDRPTEYTYRTPSTVYFGSGDSPFRSFFTFIDFSSQSLPFLRTAGVKDEPTAIEITQQLVKNPSSFLASAGTDAYRDLLRMIAAHWSTVVLYPRLVQDMKASAFLIGIKGEGEVELGDGEGDEDGENEKDKVGHGEKGTGGTKKEVHATLARAMDIYLIDDTILNQLFQPLSAPMEEAFEQFYEHLGSHWISTQVDEIWRPRGSPIETERSRRLQRLIRERAPILLYDGHQMRNAKDVASNAESLMEELSVVEVPDIEIVRTFLGQKRTQRTSSCLLQDRRSKKNYLFIAGEYDYFDVASALGKVLLKKGRLNDTLLLSTLLSTSLVNLKRKGFPVDRILNLQAQKLRTIASGVSNRSTSPVPSPGVSPAPTRNQDVTGTKFADSAEVRSRVDQVMSMFPDADPETVVRYLDVETDDHVMNVTNRMLDQGYPRALKVNGSANGDPLRNAVTRESQVATAAQVAHRDFETDQSASNEVVTANDGARQVKNAPADDLFKLFNRFATTVRRGVNSVVPGVLPFETASTSSTSTAVAETTTFEARAPNQELLPISPSQTNAIRSSLVRSVRTLQSSQESAFHAEIPNDPPPVPHEQTSNMCHVISDADLTLLQHIDLIQLYIDRRLPADAVSDLESRRFDVRRFARVVRTLCNAFEIDTRAVAIYYDCTGDTIAFNRGRSLFFNFRYFLGLHCVERGSGGAGRGGEFDGRMVSLPGAFGSGTERGDLGPPEAAEVFYYWYLVFSHELAHNFVSGHNADHEFFLVSFAEHFMPRLLRVLREEGVGI